MAKRTNIIDRDPTRLRERWVEHIQHTKTPATLVAYRYQLQAFHRFLGDIAEWDDVETEDVFAFLVRPRDRTASPAKASIERDVRILRSFFRWIDEEGALTLNPMARLEPPRGARTEPREPLSDELWLTIWNGRSVTAEDRLWLGLAYFCGMRREEMALLSPAGVKPRTASRHPGTLQFIRKGGAKRAGISYAAIIRALSNPEFGLPHLVKGGPDWMDLLEWMARTREDQVFLLEGSTAGHVASSRRLYDRFRAIQRDEGIPPSEWGTLHQMRHAAATNLALCGVPAKTIQRQLSHSNERMTDHYTSTAGQDLDRWLDQKERGALD